jgi:hypothetical protein
LYWVCPLQLVFFALTICSGESFVSLPTVPLWQQCPSHTNIKAIHYNLRLSMTTFKTLLSLAEKWQIYGTLMWHNKPFIQIWHLQWNVIFAPTLKNHLEHSMKWNVGVDWRSYTLQTQSLFPNFNLMAWVLCHCYQCNSVGNTTSTAISY